MNTNPDNRFEDFFTDDQYLILKNYLYNYLLRKRAVQRLLKHADPGLLLEIGSGISPLADKVKRVIYSNLSFDAVNYLKKSYTSGYFVVADGKCLPFKSNIYSHVICSEVLEHLEDDRTAIAEIYRTLKKPGGKNHYDPGGIFFSIIEKHRSESDSGDGARHWRLIRLAAPVFKWLNFLFIGLVWLDAQFMPWSLATVILIESDVSARKS